MTLFWLTTEAATVAAAAVGPCCCYCWIDSEACRKDMVIAVSCRFARLRGMHLIDDTSAFVYVAPSPASSSSCSPCYSTREQLNGCEILEFSSWKQTSTQPIRVKPRTVSVSPRPFPAGVHGGNSLASLAPLLSCHPWSARPSPVGQQSSERGKGAQRRDSLPRESDYSCDAPA